MILHMSDDIVQYSWHKPSVCVVDFRYFYYTKRNEFMLFLFGKLQVQIEHQYNQETLSIA